jgi:hypothetical protein
MDDEVVAVEMERVPGIVIFSPIWASVDPTFAGAVIAFQFG